MLMYVCVHKKVERRDINAGVHTCAYGYAKHKSINAYITLTFY